MKILVVDDIAENRTLLRKMLGRMQHQVICAENGQLAVDSFIREQPDLILMDILMPVMNGLEAIKTIRALMADKWVPIMVLSALSDARDVIESLQAGADDYLTKPIHQAILAAKIASVQRSVVMQRKILDDAQQLKAYRDQNEREHQFVQSIFERLIKQNDLKDEQLQFWLQPAQRFSGDLLCAHRTSPRQLYFMLADATGHGLAAALPTVLVNQIFQSMSRKRLPVSVIAREMNRVLHTQLPIGRFVALVIGMMDTSRQSIELWNGGLPDAWILDDSGQLLHAFRSDHTFAGVLADDEFDDSCAIWHWREPCELFICSDGVTDAANDEQELFGRERLFHLVSKVPSEQRVAAVRDALQSHMQSNETQDDISCLAIQCR